MYIFLVKKIATEYVPKNDRMASPNVRPKEPGIIFGQPSLLEYFFLTPPTVCMCLQIKQNALFLPPNFCIDIIRPH